MNNNPTALPQWLFIPLAIVITVLRKVLVTPIERADSALTRRDPDPWVLTTNEPDDEAEWLRGMDDVERLVEAAA